MSKKTNGLADGHSEIVKKQVESPIKIGVGDIGSNKFHFCVYGENNKIIATLDATPALGKGMLPIPPYFTEQSLELAEQVLRKTAVMFATHNIPLERTRCYGTAALREVERLIKIVEVSGDVEATKTARASLTRLRNAFLPYSFAIISGNKEATLVTEAALLDLTENPLLRIRELIAKQKLITVVHRGGRSTEMIDLIGNSIVRKKTLAHGIYTNSSSVAPKFAEDLKRQWTANEKPFLAVESGVWLAVGKLIGAKGGQIYSRQDIEKKLTALMKKDEVYFKAHGAETRVPYIVESAQALLEIVRHTNAQAIMFLKSKMIRAIAAELRVNLTQAQPGIINAAALPISSKRPAFPLTQARTLRA